VRPPGAVSPTGTQFRGKGANSARSNVTCLERSYISLYSTRSVDLGCVNMHAYNFLLVDQSSPNIFLQKVGGPVVDHLLF